MQGIAKLSCPDAKTMRRLLAIWEKSVAATHHFLTREDIAALKPYVQESMARIGTLYVYYGENDEIEGFMGLRANKIEMLFVDAGRLRTGIGGRLVAYALEHLGACRVDVNEENEGALKFYKKMGFRVRSRSAQDEQGNDFPILHMEQ